LTHIIELPQLTAIVNPISNLNIVNNYSKDQVMRDLLDKLNQIMENRIVLGKSGTNAKKFMEKFLDISSPHPFEKNSRMLNNVVLNLEITGNKIRISDLYSLEKRTGNASKALKILTDLADDMSVNLEATVKPYTKNI
jgi:hypothetical protein